MQISLNKSDISFEAFCEKLLNQESVTDLKEYYLKNVESINYFKQEDRFKVMVDNKVNGIEDIDELERYYDSLLSSLSMICEDLLVESSLSSKEIEKESGKIILEPENNNKNEAAKMLNMTRKFSKYMEDLQGMQTKIIEHSKTTSRITYIKMLESVIVEKIKNIETEKMVNERIGTFNTVHSTETLYIVLGIMGVFVGGILFNNIILSFDEVKKFVFHDNFVAVGSVALIIIGWSIRKLVKNIRCINK